MKLRRSHGLTVFFSLKKYFWVLVLPVIRAVLLYGADVENAFAGYGADKLYKAGANAVHRAVFLP